MTGELIRSPEADYSIQFHHLMTLLPHIAVGINQNGEIDIDKISESIENHSSRLLEAAQSSKGKMVGGMLLSAEKARQYVGTTESSRDEWVRRNLDVLKTMMLENGSIELNFNPDEICMACQERVEFFKLQVGSHCADQLGRYDYDEQNSQLKPQNLTNMADLNILALKAIIAITDAEIQESLTYGHELSLLDLDKEIRRTNTGSIIMDLQIIRSPYFLKAVFDYSRHLQLSQNEFYAKKKNGQVAELSEYILGF